MPGMLCVCVCPCVCVCVVLSNWGVNKGASFWNLITFFKPLGSSVCVFVCVVFVCVCVYMVLQPFYTPDSSWHGVWFHKTLYTPPIPYGFKSSSLCSLWGGGYVIRDHIPL